MTPDKTPMEMLKKNCKDFNISVDGDENKLFQFMFALEKSMQEYADQEKRKAFNEALELAAEKAKLKLVDTKMNNSYVDMMYIVDKQSILNLKIK